MPSFSPRLLLPVPHFLQRANADCLPACALMVLMYLGRSVRYPRLLRLLVTKEHGTPFSNLRHLDQLGVQVTIAPGTLDQLYDHLRHNRPCIVSVQTAELPHWEEQTDHAVVVVGMDSQYIYVNDPAFEIAPILVPLGDFDLAWLAKDEDFAVCR